MNEAGNGSGNGKEASYGNEAGDGNGSDRGNAAATATEAQSQMEYATEAAQQLEASAPDWMSQMMSSWGRGGSSQHYCHVCEVDCQSAKALKTHMAGNKHKRKEEEKQKQASRAKNGNNGSSNVEQTRIET